MVSEVVIDVVNEMVTDVVNEVVIEMVSEVVIDVVGIEEVVMEYVVGMWMVVDQQVWDGVQLVVLILHL
ncbi:hypothetical protein Tco_0460440, partial [Tanacetum coccineum]